MLEIFLDALKDTAIVAIFIFMACLIIEFIEQNAVGSFKANKILTGKLAPLISASVGIIPQCGFSVVATKLYAKRHIQVGTLLAVYIATSDEAVPILIANPSKVGALLPVLAIKFIFALVVGFFFNAIMLKRESKRLVPLGNAHEIDGKSIGKHSIQGCEDEKNNILDSHNIAENHNCEEHNHEGEEQNQEGEEHNRDDCDNDIGCCGHIVCENPKYQKVITYFVHPLIHTLKIVLFIFIVNFLFGTALFYIGEDKLVSFMLADSIFQPFLAALVGLIPNCASSVVITELYIIGGLSLGSLIAGLSVNAGIAFAILFKENKHFKENILIVLALYFLSSLLGIAVCAIQNAISF